MTVKRLEWEACDAHNCHCDIVESKDGDMVNYDDYAALKAELDEARGQVVNLAVENAEMKSKARELIDEASIVYRKYNDTQMPDRNLVDEQTFQEMHDVCQETPATDAAIANWQAQGVERFAEHPALGIIACSHIALEFAANLRKGAAV